MKNFRFLSLLLPLILFSGFIYAQKRTISGKVTDQSTGAPLAGPTVISDKSEGATTTTKDDGTYSITIAQGKTSLVFSYVGYTTQTVSAEGKTVINISLAPAVTSNNEVVVIGYGTQRKRDLTGSIVSITAKDLEKVPVIRADQMIQGRASGVQVIQTNQAPGGNISIRIRGTNS